MKKLNFSLLTISPQSVKPSDTNNMCKCSNCGNTFRVDDCEQDHDHHDGWEMPSYTEILCKICPDGGCVDDFWHDPELV